MTSFLTRNQSLTDERVFLPLTLGDAALLSRPTFFDEESHSGNERARWKERTMGRERKMWVALSAKSRRKVSNETVRTEERECYGKSKEKSEDSFLCTIEMELDCKTQLSLSSSSFFLCPPSHHSLFFIHFFPSCLSHQDKRKQNCNWRVSFNSFYHSGDYTTCIKLNFLSEKLVLVTVEIVERGWGGEDGEKFKERDRLEGKKCCRCNFSSLLCWKFIYLPIANLPNVKYFVGNEYSLFPKVFVRNWLLTRDDEFMVVQTTLLSCIISLFLYSPLFHHFLHLGEYLLI